METMNYRCPACLEEFAEGRVCPHCGFDGTQAAQPPFLRIGTVLQNRYRIGRSLHANGEGSVYLAYDREKNTRVYIREYFPQAVCYRMEDGAAVSVMSGGEEAFLSGKNEFLQLCGKLQSLDNQSILNVHHIFNENNTAYASMQYCPGGTLRQLIERKETPLSWNQVRRLFLPVMDTLISLHQNGTGHYGLSPDTLYLFPDGTLRIGGFAIEAIRRAEQDFAPELFAGCAALEQYAPNQPLTEATDVYALTACMLYALTGTLPQEADRRKYDQRLLISNAMLEMIPPYVVAALAGGLQVYADKRTQSFELLKKALYTEPQATPPVQQQPAEEPVKEEKKEKKKRTTGRSSHRYHAHVPDFLSGSIAFLVSAAILAHVCINYVRNDPDYPYLELDFSFLTSSVGASFGGSSSIIGSGSSDLSDTSSGEITTSSQPEVVIPEGAVEVPDFMGQTYESVSSNTTFRILLSGKEFSEEIEEGCVISQNISGYALPGSYIAVTVSRGSLMREMPELVGLSLEEARAKLVVSGFVMGSVIEKRNDGLPIGTVIGFNDETIESGEKYEYGMTVDLIVSFREDPLPEEEIPAGVENTVE